jgi:hypothetical protein
MALFGGGAGLVGGATVRLFLDDSNFKGKLAAAEAETKAASGTMSKFGGVAKQAFLIGGVAAGAFAVSSIKAFMESEEVMAQFNNTLSMMPKLAGETAQAFQEQATALQALTGYQDEEIISADNVLARFKLTGDEIRSAIPVILDYARAMHTDVPTAAGVVGKALLGNTRALKAVGIEFTATGNTAKDFDTILGKLQGKVGGAAEAFGGTMAGQLEIAKAKFNDAQEAVGKALIPALTKLLGVITPLIPAVSFLADNLLVLVGAFAGLKLLTPLIAGFKALNFAMSGLTTASAGLPLLVQSVAGLSAGSLAGGILLLAAAFTDLGFAIGAFINDPMSKLEQKVDAASGSTEKWAKLTEESASAGRFAGAKVQALGEDYLETAAVTQVAADKQRALAYNFYQSGRAAQDTEGAVSDLADAHTGLLGPLGGAIQKMFLARQHAEDLADAEEHAAQAAENMARKQDILAGGLLGVLAAGQQVAEDHREIAKLQDAGKTHTQAYFEAVQHGVGDYLALKSATAAYNADADHTAHANELVKATLQNAGAQMGATQGDIGGLVGSFGGLRGQVATANAELARANALIAGLHDKDVKITVTTEYRTIKNAF